MQHDSLPAEVAGFLREAAFTFGADAPTPGPQLAQLFATGLPAAAATAAPHVPSHPRTTSPRRPSMFRAKLASLPVKIAFGAAGLTFATTGLAAANALPTPVQEIAADLGDVVGIDVPVPTDSTTDPATDTTTDPTTDTTTDSTTDPTTDTTTDGTTTTVPTDGTAPPDAAAALPPPATTASEAAHIHDFDEACGNHGHYVSYVAQNGAEPACATEARAKAAAPPAADATDPVADATDPVAGATAKASKSGSSAKATSSGSTKKSSGGSKAKSGGAKAGGGGGSGKAKG